MKINYVKQYRIKWKHGKCFLEDTSVENDLIGNTETIS